MKTLDEVIKAFDNWMPDCDSCVFYCDIYGENNCTIADALHYLREYRAEKDSLANARALTQEAYEKHINWIENCKREYERMIEQGCEFQQAKEEYEAQASEMRWVNKHFAFEDPNEPLTWDELKQMEGKPVWVDPLSTKALHTPGWGLVGKTSFTTWEGVECCSIVKVGVTYALPVGEYGKTWQAYRKEREK